MKRRECINLLGLTIAGSLISGCEIMDDAPSLSAKLAKGTDYEESFSTIYLSTDDKKLIVMTEKYHYIFDAPYPLVVALKTELHSAVAGRLQDMYVDGNNNQAQIAVELKVKPDATAIQKQLAAGSGFTTQNGSEQIIRLDLKGTRYLSGGLIPPANATQLNKPYQINVHVALSRGQKAGRVLLTPITLGADGVLMIGTLALYALVIPVTLLFYHWDH